MRIATRAATLAATLAFVAAPLATPSQAAEIPPVADGCVTQWIANGGIGQYAIDFDRFQYNTVHVNPDGSIYIQPLTPVNLAAALAGAIGGRIVALVTCIV